MIKRFTLITFLLFCAVVDTSPLFAQDKIADSIQLHQTTANLAAVFNKAVSQQSRIFNGPAFVPYTFRTVTNANFMDTVNFSPGTVNYDGIVYTHVPLIYNINRDMLVSLLYNQVSMFTLLSDKVAEFDLLGHHFTRLQPDSLNSQMTAGFYDELYHGKLQLLARRTKDIETESVSRGIGNIFVEKSTDYYLKKGARYYSVNSQGKFFDVLKDKKQELKQYLKDNKVKFGDNTERVMAALAAYYDHITN